MSSDDPSSVATARFEKLQNVLVMVYFLKIAGFSLIVPRSLSPD